MISIRWDAKDDNIALEYHSMSQGYPTGIVQDCESTDFSQNCLSKGKIESPSVFRAEDTGVSPSKSDVKFSKCGSNLHFFGTHRSDRSSSRSESLCLSLWLRLQSEAAKPVRGVSQVMLTIVHVYCYR